MKGQLNNNNSNIQVVLRKRPLLQKELEKGNGAEVVQIVNKQQINLLDPDDINKQYNLQYNINKNRFKETHFTFDSVFDENANNFQIYQEVGESYLNNILEGFNTTIFAYGATSAGKTYTMIGNQNTPGLMNMMVDGLFAKAKQKEVTHDIIIKIAYMEIYNENLKDLLSVDQKNLDLREDPKSDVIQIHGLTEVEVVNSQDVVNLLKIGVKNRSKDSTISNEASSRSHAILQIQIESIDRAEGLEKEISVSKLSLVDLAGSERAWANKSKANKIEGAKINQSLLTLGNCIQALSEQSEKGPSKNNFIPYRGSKLTRLLKDSLGGNCRTVMIANITGSILSFEDTYNTLQYASRAKNIKVHVQKNIISSNNHVSNYAAIIEKLNKENENLRNILNNDSGIIKLPPISGNSPQFQDNAVDPKQTQLQEQFEQNIQQHFDEEQGCLRSIQEAQLKIEKINKMIIKLNQELQRGSLNKDTQSHYKEQLQINQQGIQNMQNQIQDSNNKFRSLQEGRKQILQRIKGSQLQPKFQQYLTNLCVVNEVLSANIEKEFTFKKNEGKIKEKEFEISELSDQLQLRDKILLEQKKVLVQNDITPQLSKFQNIKDTHVIIQSFSLSNSYQGSIRQNIYQNHQASMHSIDYESIPSPNIAIPHSNRYPTNRGSAERQDRNYAKHIMSIQDIQNLVKPKSKSKKKFIPTEKIQSQANLFSKNHSASTNNPYGNKKPLYPYLNAKKQRVLNMQGDPSLYQLPGANGPLSKRKHGGQSLSIDDQSTANISYSESNLSPKINSQYQSFNYQIQNGNKQGNHLYSIQNLETYDSVSRKSANHTPSTNGAKSNKINTQRNMNKAQQRKNVLDYNVHKSPYVKSFKNAEDASIARKNKLMQLNLNLDNLKEQFTKKYFEND